MSLYRELSEQRIIIENELIMLEKEVDAARDERNLKQERLDDVDKCLRALEKENESSS